MDLQLDQLKTFIAVIEQGTLEAAARELQITPSAVSQRLKALETSAGRVLLRRTKPATVTESGEVVLRLARQMALLESDALASLGAGEGGGGDGEREGRSIRVSIVVNADSLATWMLPALAEMPAHLAASFDVYREDEAHSIELLRNGTAMAAVTSTAEPVQGCTVHALGRMRYRPMASPGFARAWFESGLTPGALALAPVVLFDRKDDLQDQFLRRRVKRSVNPPRHYIPASSEFAEAVRLGLGWGMLPDFQSVAPEAAGELVALEPGAFVDVPLYWQRWRFDSPILAVLSETVEAAASRMLRN